MNTFIKLVYLILVKVFLTFAMTIDVTIRLGSICLLIYLAGKILGMI